MKMARIGIGWALIVAALIYGLYIRFTHSELTETQMIVQLWPHWVGLTVVCVAGFFLVANPWSQYGKE